MTRAELILGLLVAILATLLAFLAFKDNPWKAKAVTAQTQAGLNATTGAIADQASERTTRIILQSEPLAHAVETAPGGDAPIPDAVRDSWSSAIGGMRERTAFGPADHSEQPAG